MRRTAILRSQENSKTLWDLLHGPPGKPAMLCGETTLHNGDASGVCDSVCASGVPGDNAMVPISTKDLRRDATPFAPATSHTVTAMTESAYYEQMALHHPWADVDYESGVIHLDQEIAGNSDAKSVMAKLDVVVHSQSNRLTTMTAGQWWDDCFKAIVFEVVSGACAYKEAYEALASFHNTAELLQSWESKLNVVLPGDVQEATVAAAVRVEAASAPTTNVRALSVPTDGVKVTPCEGLCDPEHDIDDNETMNQCIFDDLFATLKSESFAPYLARVLMGETMDDISGSGQNGSVKGLANDDDQASDIGDASSSGNKAPSEEPEVGSADPTISADELMALPNDYKIISKLQRGDSAFGHFWTTICDLQPSSDTGRYEAVRALVLIAAFLEHGQLVGFADNARANAKLHRNLALDDWNVRPSSWDEYCKQYRSDILWIIIWDVVENFL